MNKTKGEITQEALAAVLAHSRCSAEVAMGAGKTRLGLLYIQNFYEKNKNIKVLVVAPKLSIFQSWKDEMIKWDMNHLLDHVDYSTYLSLTKQQPGYDILIMDEIHSALDTQREYLNNHQGRILGLSGTMPKYEYSEKGKIIEEFAPVVYRYSVDEAVENLILNDYRIIVHPLQLSKKRDLWKAKKGGGGWMTSEQDDYNSLSKWVFNASSPKEKHLSSIMRMSALKRYKTKEVYAKKLFNSIDSMVVAFCNTKEQAENMCSHAYYSGNRDSKKNLELFKEKKVTRLSCVLQLNEGINLPVQESIIMHSYGNERKFSQRLGRNLRLNPDELGTIHVLVFSDTVDEKWVRAALSDFDETKIIWKSGENELPLS